MAHMNTNVSKCDEVDD